MAKRQKKSVDLLLPLDGAAIDRVFNDRYDALCQFCDDNDIPYEDEEYDFGNLLSQCIFNQYRSQYEGIYTDARAAVLASKGHVLIEGIPTTDTDDIDWGLIQCEPVYDDAHITHIRMTVQDADVAMLIKLAVA